MWKESFWFRRRRKVFLTKSERRVLMQFCRVHFLRSWRSKLFSKKFSKFQNYLFKKKCVHITKIFITKKNLNHENLIRKTKPNEWPNNKIILIWQRYWLCLDFLNFESSPHFNFTKTAINIYLHQLFSASHQHYLFSH